MAVGGVGVNADPNLGPGRAVPGEGFRATQEHLQVRSFHENTTCKALDEFMSFPSAPFSVRTERMEKKSERRRRRGG